MIKKTIRLIARNSIEALGYTVASVGLIVALGSAYTQVMIGLSIGFVLLGLGILMARLL